MSLPLFLLALCFSVVRSEVTVYYATWRPSATNLPQAYNPIVLNAPPVPSPPPPNTFAIQLQNNNSTGLSIPHNGNFFGFSIEFESSDEVLGKNGSVLQPAFLNLMANIQERAGSVNVRIGGTSQDTATLVGSLSGGSEESLATSSNSLIAPPVYFTTEFLYMMNNISSLVNLRWYLGIPFNDTSNFRLGIAEYGQAILGQNLLGLEVGDEPDQYVAEGLRPFNYSPVDYFNEFGQLVSALETATVPSDKILIGPGIVSGTWSPEIVWDTGFVSNYSSNLAALAVQKYPTGNCGIDPSVTAQSLFPTYLNHTSAQSIVAPYLNSASIAQGAGKPLLMFETNSASCGGYPGLSDSFGAALWALDYALQMAYGNFSGALFHNNGQNSSYNAFTPPPPADFEATNWTVGPVYYSALAMAETLGSSNQSQVVDLQANAGNIYTPAYAIYEKGQAAKVALFNYISDSTGAHDVTANISVSGSTPSSVQVKYLLAQSVSQKGNFTWAGQTLGGTMQSDGTLQGQESVQTITCQNGVCPVKIPAPGFALVFLSNNALEEASSGPTTTFATTVSGNQENTATINPSVLATSNGRRPIDGHLGSTSKGKMLYSGGIRLAGTLPNVMVLLSVVSSVLVMGRVR